MDAALNKGCELSTLLTILSLKCYLKLFKPVVEFSSECCISYEGKQGRQQHTEHLSRVGGCIHRVTKAVVDGNDTEDAAQFLATQAIPLHYNTPSTPKTEPHKHSEGWGSI